MSWEDAVLWLRAQPDQADVVRACYYDDPLSSAADRFYRGPEWNAVRAILPKASGRALDLGAGRGISSYALAKDGWDTVALEPNESKVVGTGAIRQLRDGAQLPIEIVREWGEQLPFADASFDVVYCRAVLHHAQDLYGLCREIGRVLKPGGMLLATREHVISKQEDLPAFFLSHPLHRLYGGENAFLLADYLAAIRIAGVRPFRVLNPYQSDINLFPETMMSLKSRVAAKLKLPSPRLVPDALLSALGRFNRTPGRLFTFVGKKSDG